MCHANNEKQKTTSDGRNRTTKSERSEKKPKQTYKCLGILEADTIKQVAVKEKDEKRISQEN